MNQKLKEKAYDLYDNGDLYELYDLLQPLTSSGDPHIYYLARFSLPDKPNLFENMDGMELLIKAAKGNVPNAVYELAVDYMLGDEIEKDETKAAQLFKQGASLGHGMCILTHGQNLYNGWLGVKTSKDEGLKLVKKAVDMGVEQADKALENIKKRR